MRKVLSFVLVLSLVLGSFGMAFAANDDSAQAKKTSLSDINGMACEDAVRVLTELDVVSGYEDGTYKPEQTVTRAEMASLVIKALGLKESSAVPKFADSKTHWAKGYIAYANTLNIISGRSETVFDPDATVTYDEASTMLIKALGYEDSCLIGTFPASYVSRAKLLGILDGVTATGGTAATRGDIAVMLYQTLDQAIGKVDKDGNFQATVKEYYTRNTEKNQKGDVKEYDTMLGRLGAYVIEPEDHSAVGIDYAREDVDSNAFLVTGDEESIINLTPYKGAVVSAYANEDDEIIAIKEQFTTFISGRFDDGDFDTDSKFILADGTEYTMKKDAISDISKADPYEVVTFENGDEKTLKNQSGDDLTPALYDANTKNVFTLSAEISGKKIDDIHSVLHWTVKDEDAVNASDLEDIDSAHRLLGVDFPEDNNGNIATDDFELVGVASLSDVKDGNIVYVYENDDKEIARVAVGQTTVTGNVSRVNSGTDKITLEGNTYKYAAQELAGNGVDGKVDKGDIEADDDVTIYLDAYGYIYDSDTVGGADNFAVVLDVGETAGMKGGDPQIELFLADGTSKIFDVDIDEDDANDDAPGLIGANDTWTANAKTTLITQGSIVKYGLDKNGKISSLYTTKAAVKVEAGSTISSEDIAFVNVAGGKSISAKGYYDGKEISKNAVIFNYTGDGSFNDLFAGTAMGDDSDDYAVVTYDSVLDTDVDNGAYYVYDTDKKEIVALLLNDATSSNDMFAVISGGAKNNSAAGGEFDLYVDGKSTTLNADKDLIKSSGFDVPYGWGDGKTDKLDGLTNPETKDAMALYKVKLDANGDIDKFEEWYKSGDDGNAAYINITKTSDKKLFDSNEFDAKDAGTLYNDESTDKKLTTTKQAIGSLTVDKDAYIYKYDRVDEEWQIGSRSDLNDLRAGDLVRFYDVLDEDDAYDHVLIYQNPSSRNSGDKEDETSTADVTIDDATKDVEVKVTELKDVDKVVSATFNGTNIAKSELSYQTVTLKSAILEAAQEDAKDVTVDLVIKFSDQAAKTIKVTVKQAGNQAKADAAIAAITSLDIPSTTATAVTIKCPADHQNGAEYTLAVSDKSSVSGGGDATVSGDVTITRDSVAEFTFTLTITATSKDKTKDAKFTVTVPTGNDAVTYVKQ